jgi:hypothetical protein
MVSDQFGIIDKLFVFVSLRLGGELKTLTGVKVRVE